MTGRLAQAAAWLYEDLGLVLVTEAVLVLAVLICAACWPRLAARWFQAIEDVFRPLLDRPRLQLVFVGVLAIAARAVMLPVVGFPVPGVHDEHSLLLQAQTFAVGRMTNPTHPHWQHFENVHINQEPTYSSIYFPGRGFPLTVGIWLAGHPWIGVWLSMILMAAAICWMLQAWVPSGFALLGGILIVARYGVFSYWINSYWGGAFTATGGALILGALPRILRQKRLRDSVLMGLGLLILLTTRPYEGMLLSLPVMSVLGAALGVWMVRYGRPVLPLLKLVAPVPIFLVFSIAVAAYHSWRVTGSPITAPYEVNRQKYAKAPALLVAKPYPEPTYTSERMRLFYDWEWRPYQRRYSISGVALSAFAKIRQFWIFYLSSALTIPFLVCLGLFRDRKVLFLIATGLFFMTGYLLETWGFAHYASPITALVMAMVLLGLAHLRGWQWRGAPVGLFLSRALPAVCLLILLLPATASYLGWPSVGTHQGKYWCCALSESSYRQSTLMSLKQQPGQDLVLVRYGPDYPIHLEWVYNGPDIDHADIVWAHDLGEQRNAELIGYFSGRKIWLLELNSAVPKLSPYP
jgi:hypothetical protein